VADVASIKLAFPLSVAAMAGIVWYLWSTGGQTHGVSLDTRAFGSTSYEPYAWWMTHRTGGTTRNYPTEMAPNCLPVALANEDGAISTSQDAMPYG
jgi:hypothetical protein